MTGEPVPKDPAPPGFRRVPKPAINWRVLPADTAKRCRFAGGVGHRHCGEPAVAELNRKAHYKSGVQDMWWPYCTEHTNGYHRWVVGDRVLEWHLEPGAEEAE